MDRLHDRWNTKQVKFNTLQLKYLTTANNTN